MDEPNDNILIFKGKYVIIGKENKYTCEGKIEFEWLPENRVIFEGRIEKESQKFQDEHKTLFPSGFDFEQKFKIEIDGLLFGEGYITGYSLLTRNLHINFYGFIAGDAIKGDKSISVSSVNFSISNFKEIIGLPINFKSKNGEGTIKGRLKLTTPKFDIKIDKCLNYDSRLTDLKRQGGYIILYNGQISVKSNSISYKEIKDFLESLSVFLSFLNGSNCSCSFLKGIYDDNIPWEDYTAKSLDTYKPTNSWLPQYLDNDSIQITFNKFQILWKKRKSKNFLSVAIHWYIQSNRLNGDISGAIILAQTGIELIFNYWIVEQKEIIIGKDSESLRASNKIRILLSQLDLDFAVDNTLINLIEYSQQFDSKISAPEILVEIRNSIVHSTSEKLEKVLTIDSKAKFEGHQLMVKYIELSLLKILDYNAKFYDRCSLNSSERYFGRMIPWIINTDS